MTPDRAIESHAVTVAVEARITELLAQRRWDRRWRADWSPARHAREAELRALVRLVRTGRRLARETLERQDAVSAAKADQSRSDYHGWQAAGPVTEPELFAGYAGSRP